MFALKEFGKVDVVCKSCRRILDMTKSRHPNCVRYTSQAQVPHSDEENNNAVAYTVSKEDFHWVKRLFPPSRIPDPPKHTSYPTPSGWSPPAETPPNVPYFVSRNHYHVLPVNEMKIKVVVYTKVSNIEGDVWALNEDLANHLRPRIKYDLATTVNEVAQKIYIKGSFQEEVEKFLLKKGF